MVRAGFGQPALSQGAGPMAAAATAAAAAAVAHHLGKHHDATRAALAELLLQ